MNPSSEKQQNISMQEAMRLAQTDTGKQLLQLLRQQNGQQLQTAMDQAAAGDYESVKKTMSSLLQNEQVKQLLQQLGGQHG